ncbi:tubby-like F-box protein 5 [Olea europaea var. sylvestris]|uniref:tubby-like F-box protein 5 n=1 Tax=Olea europaea var. sylvestris TaxID=158386 RepID=UPI000C1D213E|nr:tubby-like F-box protein 5 [Olea europaea var. sylvestris]
MLVFHLISSIAAKSDSSLYIKLTFDIVLYLGTYAGASLSICSSHKNVLWKFQPLIYCILEDLDVNQHVSFHIQYRKSSYSPDPLSESRVYVVTAIALFMFLMRVYFLIAAEESDKLLLAAKKIRRATSTDFVVSLVADDFSRASNTYVGRLRSNFLGTKFTIYDCEPPNDAAVHHNSRSSRRFNTRQVSPRLPAYNYNVATISYELNVLRTRGPRRMNCVMSSIPVSSIQEGGTAPTPTSFPQCYDDKSSSLRISEGKDSALNFSSRKLSSSSLTPPLSGEPLVLKNKAPRWHEQLQCWCLNFKGRVTVASVKNFQLVANVDPSLNISAAEQEKVILQFGKIGKDIFTMDYRYPLTAFQAFLICLSSFDSKPACE